MRTTLLIIAFLAPLTVLGALAVSALAGEGSPGQGKPLPDKRITKEVVVHAPPGDVWKAWTTNEGAETFFAPKTNIELAFGGMYEVYFMPDAPPGQRGGEGTRTLSYVPGEMASFEWSFPPSIPSLRSAGAHTFVVVQITDAGGGASRVRLTQGGWREGADWDAGFGYFEKAWDIVLGRLAERFEKGPIDWRALGR